MNHKTLAHLVTTLVGAGLFGSAAHAEVIFWRGDTFGSQHSTLYAYSTIEDMAKPNPANATQPVLAFVKMAAYTADYFFTDGTNYYRTSQSAAGINSIYQYGSSINNVLNGNVLAQNALSQTWSTNDDFWADGSGNFYRNNSNNGSIGVTRYSSFANMLAGVGTSFNYNTTYGYDDTFWSYAGKFYRTNTNNGDITGIAEYASFQALLDGQVTTTYAGGGSAKDMFMIIPTPGALALLGLAGVALRRRR